jgi:hypothetical protein
MVQNSNLLIEGGGDIHEKGIHLSQKEYLVGE